MPDEQSKVLTLVFTDLADSTALKTERGDQAVGDLIAEHREHVTRIADESLGRVIDWAGDGCFLTFDTSSAGVMFALRLQQAHADDGNLPEVRIGLHMGEVTEKEGQLGPEGPPRIEGLAVDLAARIQGLAKPGQVLMSSSVYQSARQRLGVEAFGAPILWQAYGDYSIKGFDDPLDICEAGLEGMSPLEAPEASEKAQPLVPIVIPDVEVMPEVQASSARRYAVIALFFAAIIGVTLSTDYIAGLMTKDEAVAPNPADGPIRSIAVLPLDNLMNDPEQDYFVDGMTEALISELAKIGSLKVISRTSVMQYRDTPKKASEIASELGVEGLISGSVFLDGNQVRITIELMRAADNTRLWSNKYDRALENILQLHSEVALTVAGEVEVVVTPEEQQRLTTARPVNSASYDALLRGRYALAEQSEERFHRAVDYFKEATRLDPESAEAYADLSLAYSMYHIFEWADADVSIREGRRAANRAIALDDSLARVQAAAGWVAFGFDWDWEKGEHHLREAYAINPIDPATIYGLVWVTMLSGRFDEALDIARRGVETDRFSVQALDHIGDVYLTAGNFEAALEVRTQILERFPDQMTAYLDMCWSYAGLHQYDRVVQSADQALSLVDTRWGLGEGFQIWAYALAGREEEAREFLSEMLKNTPAEKLSPTGLACAYGALGEKDEAFRWLLQAYAERGGVLLMASWPMLDPLRDDPRFTDLLRRMNHPALEWMPAESKQEYAPIEKIAVLPFDNMSSDPEQVYFVDGMTEALIAELAKIKSIKVISRTSIMQYKDTDKSLPEIARELGVDALIEGSVMKAGNDVRITAQLVHGITDEHLWAETYTNTLENVFKLQAEVALAITGEINAVVTPEEESRLTSAKQVHPEAYTEWLRGRHFKSLHSLEGFSRAKQHFERAIQFDPEFAAAYADLSLALWEPSTWGWARPGDSIEEAKEAIRRALQLDDLSSDAHAAAGFVAFAYDYDWETGERELRRALELNPANVPPYKWLVWRLCAERRFDEAIAVGKQAVEQDPLSTYALDALGDAYSNAGFFELSIPQRLQVLAIVPENEGTLVDLMVDYLRANQPEEALRVCNMLGEARGESAKEWLALVYARLNRLGEAQALFEDIEQESDVASRGFLSMALAYAVLGRTDSALDWLERGFEERSSNMIVLNTEWVKPYLESLKDEPRFKAVMDNMNFPGREETN